MIRVFVAASLLAALLHGLHFAGPPEHLSRGPLPDPVRTPGAVNPGVTQARIGVTICRRGWTRTVRPPERYTEALKRRQIREYGTLDRRLGDYEEDHLIPLELGGAPADPCNLWPQPHHAPGGWGSYRKGRLENRLKRLVCAGQVPLATAQRAIARNGIAAYRKYAAGPAPSRGSSPAGFGSRDTGAR